MRHVMSNVSNYTSRCHVYKFASFVMIEESHNTQCPLQPKLDTMYWLFPLGMRVPAGQEMLWDDHRRGQRRERLVLLAYGNAYSMVWVVLLRQFQPDPTRQRRPAWAGYHTQPVRWKLSLQLELQSSTIGKKISNKNSMRNENELIHETK